MSDYWLVICPPCRFVETGIESRLEAHRLADRHEGPGCTLRVLTEAEWERRKIEAQADADERPSSSIAGP